MKKIHTIELNLDDDFSSACAYHVDDFMTTMRRNIQHAEEGTKTNRWVLVGLAISFEEALHKCHELRMLLYQRNNKDPKSLGF